MEKPHMENTNKSQKGNVSKGFCRLPQSILNGLLIIKFSQRELDVLLFVVRLSYGCQSYCAEFLLKDLQIIGISQAHAGRIIKKLLKERWLLRGYERFQYKINEDKILEIVSDAKSTKANSLNKLIGKNLFSETSLKYKKLSTNSARNAFPNQQPLAYQNGKSAEGQSASTIDNDSKDSFINRETMEDPSKQGNASGVRLDPHTFVPKTPEDTKALQTWVTIEPNNPDSFGYYYDRIVRKKANFKVVDAIVHKIRRSTYIDNPGAYFVKQLDKYLTARKQDIKDFEEEEELF